MNEYELIVIFEEGEGLHKTRQNLSAMFTRHEAELIKETEWGNRKLPDPIKRHTTGYYLLNQLKMDPLKVKELTGELRIEQGVLRHMVKRVA